MKRKALTAIASTALAATLLASCTTTSMQLQLSPNWYANTATSNELSVPLNETLVYTVTFDKEDTWLRSEYYDVTYCTDGNGGVENGTYTTTLTGSISEGNYTFTSVLSIPVTYTYGNQSVRFIERTESEVVFLRSATKFQPVSSKKTILCHSPSTKTPAALSDCYITFDYTVEIVYDENCNTSTSVTLTDKQGTFAAPSLYSSTVRPENSIVKNDYSFTIDKSKYTYLDNEQILCALRGLSNNALQSTSYFNTYNFSTNAVQTLSLTAKTQENTTDFKNTQINGTAIGEQTAIAYNAVTLAISSSNSGGEQELWFAATVDDSANTYRNVLLKLKDALPYNIGSLTYTLTKATF